MNADDFKNAKITMILIGLNVIIFIVLNIFFVSEYAIRCMAQENYKIAEGKKIWSLLTSIFVHSGPAHLLSNMLGLFIFGTTAEKIFSKLQYIIIYLVSGLIGSIFSFILYPINVIGLGASGAIYGLMGAVLISLPRGKNYMYFVGVFYVVYSLLGPNVNWAHLFGIISGVIFALILKKRKKRKKRKKEKRKIKKKSTDISHFFKKTKNMKLFQKRIGIKKIWKRVKTKKKISRLFPGASKDKILYEKMILISFKNIIEINQKVSLNEMAKKIGIHEADLFEKILVWKNRLPIKLIEDYIIVENINEFLAVLDQIFSEWEK